MNVKRIFAGCMAVFLLASVSLFCGCDAAKTNQTTYITSIEQLRKPGIRLGIETGSAMEKLTAEAFPEAACEQYQSVNDIAIQVRNDKLDSFMVDSIMANEMVAANPDLAALPLDGITSDVAFAYAKNEAGKQLCDEMSAFIGRLEESGELEKIIARWENDVRDEQETDYQALPATNGTLTFAGTGTVVPFLYMRDNECVGLDMDIAIRFCREKGYAVKFMDLTLPSVIASLGNQADVGFSGISATDERKENMYFSSPYYHGTYSMIVKKAPNAEAAEDLDATVNFISLTQFNDPAVTVGIMTGSVYDGIVQTKMPKAKRQYYNTHADLVRALRDKKIDGYMCDRPIAESISRSNTDLTVFPEPCCVNDTAAIFPKNERGAALRDEMNLFIAQCYKDGTINELNDLWLDSDSTDHDVDIPATGEKGTVKLVIYSGQVPFSFTTGNNEYVGFEVDLVARFCKANGYALAISDVDFPDVMTGVSSGTYDIGVSCFTVTEERKENVYFCDGYYKTDGCLLVRRAQTMQVDSAYFTSLEQFNSPTVNIGIMTASVYDTITQNVLPLANKQYYNTHADLIQALKDKKIDGYMSDQPLVENIVRENPDLRVFSETCCVNDTASMFPKTQKGAALRDEMNQFIAQCFEDGTMDELNALWIDTDSPDRPIDVPATGKNGIIKMATYSGQEPFSYVKDNKNVGFEIDLIARFCKARGYGLTIDDMDFVGVMAGITTSKYDIAACSITVTEERKNNVFFCDAYYKTEGRLLVRSPQAEEEAEKSFWIKVGESFQRTFIREERWRMVVSGLWATLFISVMALLLGTLLGFGICLLRGLKNPFVHALTTGYIRIFQGTPVLVILMILFYIVFSKTNLTGEWVAIITFALNSAAYIAEIMRSGIDSIDRGQTEAALAAGYTRTHAFFRIVFPQAVTKFLPVYRGEIISQIKSTSVVGYIAVEDLTKISDIIRSRTYEAFFPLIATALIYFAISMLLSLLLTRLQKRTEPNRKSRKVKGVTEE